MPKEKEKVVLAYSGGLDTSVILKWLKESGHEVIAYVADLGQKENFKAVKEKALKTGASKVYIEDLKEELVTDFIFPVLKANAVYEGRYLLGTSLARPLTAKKQIEIAKKEKAKFVAHGATGKGNDQVRFELTYHTLYPGVQVIAPWKEDEFLKKFQGRQDLIKYAKKNGIPVKATKDKPWSSDPNLMHISYEAGILEDPTLRPSEGMFEMTVSPRKAPNKETRLAIDFKKGIPVRVKNLESGVVKTKPLELFTYLNQIGGKNGVGRIDMVENRFVGIKSRGVYETPAGTILQIAHRDLEGLTMDREVMHLRDGFMPKFAELVYYGFWFSPEMEILRTMIDKTQEFVTGRVSLSLYKGNIQVIGRESKCSLYDQSQSSMDMAGGFDQRDSKGFIKINAIRLINSVLRKRKK
ncbi:MAG: argininosuccinate synthase [Candidatus Berkelbacteria bacterium]|nr:argininosuccinate synthase [Candidatus Berkelbacteria bacterium]